MRLKFKNDYSEKLRNILGDKKLTYIIDTMGCQMNENDSLKYMGILEDAGFSKTSDEKSANLILFNTCCVRENAENTLFGRLGKLKIRKQKEKNVYIVVVGCMSQQKHILDKIKKSYPFVDIILGTNSMYSFPQKLYERIVNNEKYKSFNEIDLDVIEEIPIVYDDKYKASVSIIYGCNNYCTYCIVPYVRGKERSRKLEDILEDVKTLAKKGYKEIMYIGQNVNSYGKDLEVKTNFAELLRETEKIEGIEIIRFISPHPKDFTDELIDTIANSRKIARQIHLPLQSGSTKILKLMNRKYTKEEYLNLAARISQRVKGVSFSTDIIVGFPGETDEDFEDTIDVVKKVKYDQIYMYIYSKRVGTAAEKLEDNTPYSKKVERLETLKKLNENIVGENNKLIVGKTFKVLVEGKSKTNEELYTGRTDTNKIVVFIANDEFTGKIVSVKITSEHLWFLKGEII